MSFISYLTRAFRESPSLEEIQEVNEKMLKEVREDMEKQTQALIDALGQQTQVINDVLEKQDQSMDRLSESINAYLATLREKEPDDQRGDAGA